MSPENANSNSGLILSKHKVVVAHSIETSEPGVPMMRMAPATLASLLFHLVLFGLFFLLAPAGQAETQVESRDNTPVGMDVEVDRKDPFLTSDPDTTSKEPDTDINYNVERKSDFSIPGVVSAADAVGIRDGDLNSQPANVAAPAGFGKAGQGGPADGTDGNTYRPGDPGGYGVFGPLVPGGIGGRSAGTRDKAARDGGGTGESEAAVTRGLKWLARNQFSDGSWRLDGNFPDKGGNNDIAGTAFGLLPLLGAGKTHKLTKDNPYDKPVEKGLKFLILKQNKKTGDFGGGMYGHGLATIAMCEAFGMTQDGSLRRPAQMALNYIVAAQHAEGGWRYAPGQAGDTSVTGWQVMALKSGQMAGLDVPEQSLRKAMRFLNSCCDTANEGYGYTGVGSTPAMSAVGLLCRQYVDAWGPQSIRLIKGIDLNLLPQMANGPRQDIYFYYYATQVMHHFGGEAWRNWNEKMRNFLVNTQEKTKGNPNEGSWSSAGDAHGSSGGRLMITSLNLLTLEVYYRHLPLYWREAGRPNMAAK